MAKHRFTAFRLMEISTVTKPAQEGAKMTIMKAADVLEHNLVKMVMKAAEKSGAKTFTEILQVKEEQEKAWKVRSELWPIFDAINESIGSILSDKALTMAQKGKKVDASVNEFLSAVRAKFPDVEEEIAKALKTAGNPGSDTDKGESTMSEAEIKKLQEQLATSQAALETANALAGMTDVQKAFHAKLPNDEAKTAFVKADSAARDAQIAKANEGDETLDVDGAVVRKSEVGATMFAVLKAQNARFEKQAADHAAQIKKLGESAIRKRAQDDLEGLPGTIDEKVALLQLVDTNAEVAKTFGKIVKVYKAAVEGFFDERGVHDTDIDVEKLASEDNVYADAEKLLDEAAKTIQKADPTLSYDRAVVKALEAQPELYSAYDDQNTRSMAEDPTDK